MNPYLLDRPAVVSFSGGRTSGYMLRRVLDAFGGALPPDVAVIFCNTGKERPETLDFVERCSQEWGVPIVWLEYRYAGGRHGFAVVDYATASRAGEPFEAVITHHRDYRAQSGLPPVLPNPVQRFCTAELKLRTMRRYCVGVLGWGSWTSAIGLRADEPRRVAKLRGQRERWAAVAPLAAAGVTEADVMRFWAVQPFDLRLRQYEGNCDLCFLKSAGKIGSILAERPDLAPWWIRLESTTGAKFRKDRPDVKSLLEQATRQPGFDWGDESLTDCHCTD